MGLILKLGLRNLLRQKRRNTFLGIGIGFGMMILVIANSFSNGFVDVLINEVVNYSFGHLVVRGSLGSNTFYGYTSDKAKFEKVIRETVGEDLLELNENLGSFGRVVGNGKTDNAVLVGVKAKTEQEKKDFFEGFFTLVEGNFDEYNSEEIEYPIIISEAKAKSLNVGLYDTVKMRIPIVTGQIQAAKLTVVAIANANNTFMNIVLFMEADRVKKLLGYKPWESSHFQLRLKNPKENASKYAELLHAKLQPDYISFDVNVNDRKLNLLAYRNREENIEKVKSTLGKLKGNEKEAYEKGGVLLSERLASELGVEVGETFELSYNTKFRGVYTEKFKLDATFSVEDEFFNEVLLVNEERIHKIFNQYKPEKNNGYLSKNNDKSELFATEWRILERSSNAEELEKKYKIDRRIRTKSARVDVVTMYEGASQVLKMEWVLNRVTDIAVIVLFFIILIGVINTLRMTIKERTREIGTVRSMGMQKSDVRNLFITETMLLSLFACIAGIILAVIIMKILGSIEFSLDNALSMILKDGKLNFKMSLTGISVRFVLIMIISMFTAYFPARRAANMVVADAIRHYE